MATLNLAEGDFPVEITLSSGDKYLVPHPDYTFLHPNKKDVTIYPENGPYCVMINPAHIVSLRPLRTAS